MCVCVVCAVSPGVRALSLCFSASLSSPVWVCVLCGLSSLAARPARRSSTAQSADERARTAAGCTRRAQDQERGQSTTRQVTVPLALPRLGAHISTFMCHMIANPFTPARTRPERMASSPRIRRAAMATASCCASRRGGARSNLAHGTRRPQHERVQARGCKVSASKESTRVCVLVCLSLGRSCPVPGCSSWASRFASRAP